jgi:soluble lytic murein transglycosylase-like protein
MVLCWGQSVAPRYATVAAQPAETGPVLPAESANAFVMPVYMAGNSPQNPFDTGNAMAAAVTYRQLFEDVAGQYGLDWRMLAEIAYRESGFNPWAIGRRNEMGLMQILPLTWSEWAPRVGVIDPYDPASNVQVAAAYLVFLQNYSRARGYTEPYWMLIGYNWGPNNLRQLFQQQGKLDDVPELPRHYALKILQYGPEAPIRRQEQLEAVVSLSLNPDP